MRVTSRESVISRSEFFRRCRLLAISVTSVLAIAACGGGGGGGGSTGGGTGGGGTGGGGGTSNAAPSVQAGADQTIELPTNTIDLTGTATDDSSASTLTYSWSATSGPSGVTFGSATAATTNVTFPAAGSYVLTLTVSDGSLSGTDTVAVTVNPAMYPASDTANDSADHGWTRVAAADVGMDQALLEQAALYASRADSANPDDNAGMIVRHGRLVHSWGNIDARYDMKSTTKSIGGIALGLAIDEQRLALSDSAQSRLANIGNPPANHPEWLPEITIQQLATHTAGFAKPGGYVNQEYRPGTTWFYSDGGLNWLSEVLTASFGQDLATVLNTKVWNVLGLNSTTGAVGGSSDIRWRDNDFRSQVAAPIHNRELASGIYANANAMARVGLLFLRNGVWNDQRILSESFVETVRTPVAANAALMNPDDLNYPDATTNYGVLWWTNAAGLLANVPRDAYWAWGLGDSLIVVIPSLDIVAVRAGVQAPPNSSLDDRVWNDDDWNGQYDVLEPFLDPIVQSVTND